MTPAETSHRIETAMRTTESLFNATHPNAESLAISHRQQVAIFETWRAAMGALPSAVDVGQGAFSRAYVSAVQAGAVPKLKSHARNISESPVPTSSWHCLCWQYVNFLAAEWGRLHSLDPKRTPIQALQVWCLLQEKMHSRLLPVDELPLPSSSEFLVPMLHERAFLEYGSNLDKRGPGRLTKEETKTKKTQLLAMLTDHPTMYERPDQVADRLDVCTKTARTWIKDIRNMNRNRKRGDEMD